MSRRAFALLLLAALPSRADEPSFSLTTDTPAYCTELARKVADRHSANLEVQRLLAEGREMCERGEVRGGIRRLRRAWVLVRHKVGV